MCRPWHCKHLVLLVHSVSRECVFWSWLIAILILSLPGTVGVAAVTAGPGLTNTVTAVKNAQMAESPLLLMGGAAGTLLQVESKHWRKYDVNVQVELNNSGLCCCQMQRMMCVTLHLHLSQIQCPNLCGTGQRSAARYRPDVPLQAAV